MINQEGGSNQYGFYAVPKALQPKKKYRQTYQYQDQYSDQDQDAQNNYQQIERTIEDQNQQRDYYVDQAPFPQFKPKERGLDYGVQIQKTDLFDFQMQVQPLIQILVGRSVVSAINQLQQQKQMRERKQGLDVYQKKRNAQLMVTQRMQNKNKRKRQQVERRKLQKEIFVKNQKEAGKKLISRKNAKHSLLNLKKEVLQDLQQQGFLRKQPYSDLRIHYQGFLYEQMQQIIKQQSQTLQVISNMVHAKQKEIIDHHQQYINKQKNRKQKIYDQQLKIKLANEQRKRKKKIRKQRLALNKQHQPSAQAATQQLQKYQSVTKILKCNQMGNGRTNIKNNNNTIQISGGLLNYIIVYLNQKQLTIQQIQSLIQKLLTQLQTKLQISLLQQHYQIFNQVKNKLQQDQISFMKNKQSIIDELINKIGLDLSIIQSFNIYIKTQLHQKLLKCLLNICLNAIPSSKVEGQQIIDSYQANDKDKKRQQLKGKLQIISKKQKDINEIKNTQNIIRVHFNKVRPQQQSEQKQKQQQQLLNEWVDIFDGQDWDRNIKQKYADADKNNQNAASYHLNSFNNALVVDQRNIFYLRKQIQTLFEQQGGSSLKNYQQGLQNIREKVGQVPVFDVQLQWE